MFELQTKQDQKLESCLKLIAEMIGKIIIEPFLRNFGTN